MEAENDALMHEAMKVTWQMFEVPITSVTGAGKLGISFETKDEPVDGGALVKATEIDHGEAPKKLSPGDIIFFAGTEVVRGYKDMNRISKKAKLPLKLWVRRKVVCSSGEEDSEDDD